VIADGNGIPLALSLTGGNRIDVTQVMPLPPQSSAGDASPADLPVREL
jgi:hypothetical protein